MQTSIFQPSSSVTGFGASIVLGLALLLVGTGSSLAQGAAGKGTTLPAGIAEIAPVSQGARLPGLVYLAEGAGPHPTVVLLHGIPGNEKNLDIAQELRRSGFNVVFFHYRGAWGAEGLYSIPGQPDDVAAVLAFLREPEQAAQLRVDTAHLSLLGHSLGGYVALAAGSRDDDVTCVGAMAAANVGLWKLGLASSDDNTERLLTYADSLFMLEGFGSEAMTTQLLQTPAADLDTRLFGPGLRGKSVFLIAADEDDVTPAAVMQTPVVEAYRKFDDIKLEHHVISGDHSFSWSRDQLTALLLEWLQRDCQSS